MTQSSALPASAFLVLLATLGASTPSTAADAARPGPAPLLIASENFAFTKGAWAEYAVEDLRTNAHYTMWVAIPDVTRQKGKPAAWMEIDVKMPDQPGVLTRFLVDQTQQGPGEIHEAVVQVEGMTPFRVPRKYLNTSDQGVARVASLSKPGTARSETIDWKGRKLDVIHAEGTDEVGRPIKAIVCTAVPPLAVVKAESADVRLTLESCGNDGVSRLTGKPRSLFGWIMEQIFGAAGSANSSASPSAAPAPRPTGSSVQKGF